MKRTALFLTTIFVLALLVPSAVAQCSCCRHQGPKGPWPGGPAGEARGPIYDPDTVTTLHGTVTAVEVVAVERGRSGGLHLIRDVAGSKKEVHIGPTWFLDRESIKFSKGDVVDVTGSLVRNNYVIAREVKKGEKVLKLRDDQGFPLWAGGPRRP